MNLPTILRRAYRRLRHWRDVRRLAGPKVLDALARSRPQAFFVQIGANDGQMMDPLNATLRRYPWRGVALEADPATFERLQKTYADLSHRVRAINIALAAAQGAQSFYILRNRPGLPALPNWAAGLGSLRRDVVLSHRDRLPGIEQYLIEQSVACCDWQTLCETHGITQIDVLQTDTEGYDYEIIKQVDFARTRPTLLIFEHHHLNAETRAECDGRLHQLGYTMFREGLDTWALDARSVDPAIQRIIDAMPQWIAASRYAGIVGQPAEQ